MLRAIPQAPFVILTLGTTVFIKGRILVVGKSTVCLNVSTLPWSSVNTQFIQNAEFIRDSLCGKSA